METIGSYRLGKTIGKGSYGKVRLGFHMETNRQVLIVYFVYLCMFLSMFCLVL